ncbi:hypothetical protein EV421DRAFT_1744283 [Armillaria borealis]|uniref:Uncharacterized protein n=1 Tax=Armillaria borealis TaxID=47425 RepID=A0AA39IWJ2_9AGAR|nr:hypothetical protein EV421DRAFT_1744283 [Armillaria borealis]
MGVGLAWARTGPWTDDPESPNVTVNLLKFGYVLAGPYCTECGYQKSTVAIQSDGVINDNLPIYKAQSQGLWFDCKKSEILDELVTDPLAVAGHVIPLTYKYSKLSRGASATRTFLYPPAAIAPALEKNSSVSAFQSAEMNLHDVVLDPRNIILDLDRIILEVRKFKVTLALEFQDHVVAFGFYDNNTSVWFIPLTFLEVSTLFQVYWYAAEEYTPKHWSYVPYVRRGNPRELFDVNDYVAGFDENTLSTKPYVLVDPLTYYDGFLATIVWFIAILCRQKQAKVKVPQRI